MFSNSKTLENRISSQIRHQFPEFIQSDHPTLIRFFELYYQFLESSEIYLLGSNDYIVQETEDVNYIIDESGDKIVLEQFNSVVNYGSSSKYIQGEEVYGETTNVSAKVLVDDYEDGLRLYITSQQGFEVGERIRGRESNAVATLVSYKANPVQNIQQFLSYVDVDNTVSDFFTEFKNAFLEFIPKTTSTGLSQRKLLKSIRDLYSAKGTENAHKLFFRILFDEDSLLIYPRDNILRVSDGQWSSDKIIRVIENGTSNFGNLVGQTVYSLDDFGRIKASATVANVVKFREGNLLIAELNLDSGSIVGEFVAEDLILSTDPILNIEISATIKSIVNGISINNRGFNYKISDPVTFGSGGNGAAVARVSSIGSGGITDIMIAESGSGYTVDDEIVFNNTDTNGEGAAAKIVAVGGSFILEDETDPDFLLAEDGTKIIIQDETNLYSLQLEYSESTSQILSESGESIVIEDQTFTSLGVPEEAGEITKIKVISKGNSYTVLPTLSINSTTGSGAKIFALSTQSPGVGYAREVRITNFGLNYNTSPDITFNRNVVVKNVVGNFVSGDVLTSVDGVVVNYDETRSILELKTKNIFVKGEIITSITGATAEVYFSDHATATAQIGVIGTTISDYVSERGKVSNSSMRIQDSFYYQDYSYVVRVGQSINEWRESVRRSIHPAGWNFFGEVSFSTKVSASIKRLDTRFGGIPTAELAPAIIGVLFGRRLGTKTQGTLRTNPERSVIRLSELDNNQREVTLTSFVRVRVKNARGYQRRSYGTLAQIPKFAFVTAKTNDTDPVSFWKGLNRVVSNRNAIDGEYHTIAQFGNYRINQLCDTGFVLLDDGLDGDGGKILLEDSTDGGSGYLKDEIFDIPNEAYQTYLNIPPPGEIIISNPSSIAGFDETVHYFDQSTITFDEGGVADIDTFDSELNTFDDIDSTFDEKL